MLFDDLYDFNQEWAKTHSKAQFVAEFVDHDHIYQGKSKADKTAALEQAWKILRNEPDEFNPAVDGIPEVIVSTEKEVKSKK